MSFLSRIFGARLGRDALQPLYRAIVARGRDPAWYRDGGVPDTIDGRFDMIAALMALVLIRLEAEGERARDASVLLAEAFVEDMDGSLRQLGIGDLMVGKHIGRMMGALGGRLASFRAAAEAGGGFEAPVRRNVFHDSPPSDAALGFVSARLGAFHDGLAALDGDAILAGRLP